MKLGPYDVNPTPKSLTSDPMTPVEIDNHPDADRIWATVNHARDVAYDEGFDDGYEEGGCRWD